MLKSVLQLARRCAMIQRPLLPRIEGNRLEEDELAVAARDSIVSETNCKPRTFQ